MRTLHLILIIVIIIAGISIYYKATTYNTNVNHSTILHSLTYTSTSFFPQSNTLNNKTIPELKPLKRFIELNVSENQEVIKYREVVGYNQESFNEIINSWSYFEQNITSKMNGIYTSHGAHIVGLNTTYSKADNSITITFNVTNEIWVSNNKVVADFLWFLEAWNLDFINNKFLETPQGLIWKGILDNVSTTIMVNVPEQSGPYKAWEEPYGHCHGHIWWPKTVLNP